MSSEWMKVMLEEISRKKAEAEQARIEEQARIQEQGRVDEPARVEERTRVVLKSAGCAREKKIGDAE